MAGLAADYSCSSCHAWRESIVKPRLLGEPHDKLLVTHGKSHFWCLECHNAQNMDTLHGPNDTALSYDEMYRQCAKCHSQRVLEWQLGIHGKRVGTWRGKRTILRCSACHNAHQSAWPPTTPSPPPSKEHD